MFGSAHLSFIRPGFNTALQSAHYFNFMCTYSNKKSELMLTAHEMRESL